jgi:hypothetical protein
MSTESAGASEKVGTRKGYFRPWLTCRPHHLQTWSEKMRARPRQTVGSLMDHPAQMSVLDCSLTERHARHEVSQAVKDEPPRSTLSAKGRGGVCRGHEFATQRSRRDVARSLAFVSVFHSAGSGPLVMGAPAGPIQLHAPAAQHGRKWILARKAQPRPGLSLTGP